VGYFLSRLRRCQRHQSQATLPLCRITIGQSAALPVGRDSVEPCLPAEPARAPRASWVRREGCSLRSPRWVRNQARPSLAPSHGHGPSRTPPAFCCPAQDGCPAPTLCPPSTSVPNLNEVAPTSRREARSWTWRSSVARTPPRDPKCCRGAGWWSGRSGGSGNVGARSVTMNGPSRAQRAGFTGHRCESCLAAGRDREEWSGFRTGSQRGLCPDVPRGSRAGLPQPPV
jgi:hypothetical protein